MGCAGSLLPWSAAAARPVDGPERSITTYPARPSLSDLGQVSVPGTGQLGLTVPVQPIVSSVPDSESESAPPAPLLRVVQLPAALSEAQFHEVMQELESSTPARQIVLVAPSFVSIPSPPSIDLVEELANSAGPNSAAVVLTPEWAGRDATFNAAALLYARVPERLLTGPLTLGSGAADSWSAFQSYLPDCFYLCTSLSDGQSVAYSQLLAEDGGQRVGSAAELLTDLQPQPQASMTWERLSPVSAAAFAPVFAPRHKQARPRRGASSLALPSPLIAGIAVLVALLLVAAVVPRLRTWFRRPRTDPAPRPPYKRPTPAVVRDPNALLALIGTDEVVGAPVLSGFSPQGYVEVEDCLVRATWRDPSPPPQPGATVTARLVNGALQATGDGGSTQPTK